MTARDSGKDAFFIMRRPTAIYLLLASTALFYPACSVSVGDGDGDSGDGDGDGADGGEDGASGGEGGEVSGSGGSSDGGATQGTGGADDEFVPSAFVPPLDMPVELPEVVRMGGYSSDSAALRIRDAFRATYGALNTKLTETCEWGINGSDYYIDLEQYLGLCSAACMVEHLSCSEDAELYVCSTLDADSASADLASCLSQCESFICDDNSSDTALRCDFEIDCDDASDEKTCGDLAFLCEDGSLSLSGFAVCDGEDDCSDGSDEVNCGHNGFVCSDGVRIQAAFQCDGSEDCVEGEDEEACDDLVYDCGEDVLIPWYETCDGEVQCVDASDEELGCVSLDASMCTN